MPSKRGNKEIAKIFDPQRSEVGGQRSANAVRKASNRPEPDRLRMALGLAELPRAFDIGKMPMEQCASVARIGRRRFLNDGWMMQRIDAIVGCAHMLDLSHRPNVLYLASIERMAARCMIDDKHGKKGGVESKVRGVTRDLVDAAAVIHNKGLAVWVSSTKK